MNVIVITDKMKIMIYCIYALVCVIISSIHHSWIIIPLIFLPHLLIIINKLKINQFILIIMVIMAIDNKYLTGFKVVGIDITDIIIIISVMCIYLREFKKNKNINISKGSYIFLIYIVFQVIISFVKGNSFLNTFFDSRSLVYLVISYNIFKNWIADKEVIKRYIVICGLINSIMYIVIMITSNSSTEVYKRDISLSLWMSIISFGIIVLSKSNKKRSYIIVAINLLVIFLSQVRSYLLPLILIIIFTVLKELKNINLKRIVIIILGLSVLIFSMDKIGILDSILNRLQPQYLFGEGSTLGLRLESVKYNLSLFNISDYFKGNGIGTLIYYYPNIDYRIVSTNEIEMIFFNYIIKYGVLVTGGIITYLTASVLKNRYFGDRILKNNLVLILICILIGGFISGLTGSIGQLTLGFICGLISNKKIFN